ncbi:MAG TPA: flagellar hook-associated protein FlgL [Phycisphaerae bacterium]|nr:flagellar hook-associated protein FlgL [Phycisphaerae bacterium]HRY68829.1 flagellar hook-associated protein FlgL [Phycisphaerae bacterium]HSA27494.1 flagellar hook-associated protein FlgL [Phycisphaerae bacterium]
MAVTAISINRVSNSLRSYSLLESLRANTLNLFLEQNRIASGRKLNAPSEDPVGAARATQLSEVLERQNQLLTNIQHASSFLSATDTAVGEVSSLLIDAHNIGLTMVNNGSVSHEERVSEAQLILGIIDQLATVGNRQYNGMYLFGGQQTRSTPFTQDHGVAEYRGDTASVRTTVDAGQDPAINLNGADLFGALSSKVGGHLDLDPALTASTRLVDCDGATRSGIQRGVIRISVTAPATSFQVDLTTADTIGDVLESINAAAADAGLTVGPGGQFHAALSAPGDGLEIVTTAGEVTVAESGSGTTARSLGILGSGAATIAGSDLGCRVTTMTEISSLFGGAGTALGSIHIDSGGREADVDLSGATTIQDVLNLINASGLDIAAQINAVGTAIELVNLVSGSELKIGEAGGTTATTLGIRSYYAGTLLSDMNQGAGVTVREGRADFSIRAKNDVTFEVSLTGARTVQDVLDKINAAAAAAGVAVTASLAVNGNGIRIVDSTGGAQDLVISKENLSAAGDHLGILKSTSGTEIVSDDTNGIVPDSVFTALHTLYEGLMHDDTVRISAASAKLESFIEQASRIQGEVGARAQAMDIRQQYTEDAVVATQSLLSQAQDLDYTEAVTQFQLAQTTLQANLMTGSRLMQLSLLDYLG